MSSHQIHHCAHVQGAAVLPPGLPSQARPLFNQTGRCLAHSHLHVCRRLAACMSGVFNPVSCLNGATAAHQTCQPVRVPPPLAILRVQPSTCGRFWKTTENTARSHCTPRSPPVRACVARPRHPSRRVAQLQPQMAAVNCSAMWVICRARSVKPPVLGSCIELQDERQRVMKKKKRKHGPALAPMGRVRPQSTRRDPLTGPGTVVDWLTGLTGPRIGIRIRIRLDAHSTSKY